MFIITAISEGSFDILLGLFLLIVSTFIGVLLKNKSDQKANAKEAKRAQDADTKKAERADIMEDVDKKIHEELKPVSDRMNKHDLDFKEFKKDEIEPMKQQINSIDIKQAAFEAKLDNMITGISELKNLVGKVFDILDNKQDKKK